MQVASDVWFGGLAKLVNRAALCEILWLSVYITIGFVRVIHIIVPTDVLD